MTTATQPAPASVSDAGAGDRPSATTTCMSCWHPISGYDVVSAVVHRGDFVVGFCHVECAESMSTRLRSLPLMRVVPLV
jgi:hypothetical protein